VQKLMLERDCSNPFLGTVHFRAFQRRDIDLLGINKEVSKKHSGTRASRRRCAEHTRSCQERRGKSTASSSLDLAARFRHAEKRTQKRKKERGMPKHGRNGPCPLPSYS